MSPDTLCVSIAKGLDDEGRTAVRALTQALGPQAAIAVLYGPMISEEIRAGLASPPDRNAPGLVAAWDFEDGTGRDVSGHGHDASLTGGAAGVMQPPRVPVTAHLATVAGKQARDGEVLHGAGDLKADHPKNQEGAKPVYHTQAMNRDDGLQPPQSVCPEHRSTP